LRKPALQSSVSKRYSIGRTPAEDAKGGNNGDLSCDYGFHTATERDPWWQVDLEDSFLLHRIVIFNRLSQAERLQHFTVLGSLDGMEWKILFRKTDHHVFGEAGEPFVAQVADEPRVRFVRVQLDGDAPLHFRECQVFGVHPEPGLRTRMERVEEQSRKRRNYVPIGRQGTIVQVGQLVIFNDMDNYAKGTIEALERGDYKATERQFLGQLVTHSDRVIDVGTGIGVLSMTAASKAGAESVLTVDRNPHILNDARDNFKRNGFENIHSHPGILGNRQSISNAQETGILYIDKAFSASHVSASAVEADSANTGQLPILCLEDMIDNHRATTLICDIDGGEVELLNHADLRRIRLIILKTNPLTAGEEASDEMVSQLILNGFSLHLDLSHDGVLALRRHKPR
jgi:FkbM family methyltransferase